MAWFNNGRPTQPPIAGQYSPPEAQDFAVSPPQQYGLPRPIPSNTQGITALKPFTKINKSLAPGPVAKIVINLQQSRF